MRMPDKTVQGLITAALVLFVAGLLCIAVMRPFECRVPEHLEKVKSAWARYQKHELNQNEVSSLFVDFLELEPGFGEALAAPDGRDYLTIREQVLAHTGELSNPWAFGVLSSYASCKERRYNFAAVRALAKRREQRAATIFIRVMELEDARCHLKEGAPPLESARQLTHEAMEALYACSPLDSVLILKEFLKVKSRTFDSEVRDFIDKIEQAKL